MRPSNRALELALEKVEELQKKCESEGRRADKWFRRCNNAESLIDDLHEWTKSGHPGQSAAHDTYAAARSDIARILEKERCP